MGRFQNLKHVKFHVVILSIHFVVVLTFAIYLNRFFSISLFAGSSGDESDGPSHLDTIPRSLTPNSDSFREKVRVYRPT